MNNSTLKQLLLEYSRKRNKEIVEANIKKEKIYQENPRLQEIDDELSKEAINISKKMISSKDSNLLNELNNKIKDLKEEKEKILISLGKDNSYLKPNFECKDCNDTGYITNSYESVLCHCLKQKLFDIEYNKSNISNLEKDNFEHFSLDIFSNEVNENLYHSKLSPRKNMEFIYNLSQNFIKNFDD